MKYLPFLNGIYSTAPGLSPLDNAKDPSDAFIFQVDDDYLSYINNKTCCRKEDIRKYYCEQDARPSLLRYVNEYLINQLLKEHPQQFQLEEKGDCFQLINHRTTESIQFAKDKLRTTNKNYLSLFDALCSQVQEDLAIFKQEKEKDWLAVLHLCAPNHWAATDKIGKPFDVIHAPVPGMYKTISYYQKMLESIIQKGPFTRFAWGISTDTRLNHHPIAPPDENQESWYGRASKPADVSFYIRTERQNLVGFPAVNAFLFTIRTYFYPVPELNVEEKRALFQAINTMSPHTLEYKGLKGILYDLKSQLRVV